MKKVVSIFVVAVLLFPLIAVAEEGMWRPKQLPELQKELVNMGLEADPASLSDLMSHPMNAVIWLGNCTASFVSPEGLAVTNHHCAYGSIQHNSTKENNLLENGFIAEELSDELPAAPGSRILVTVEVTDVTEKVTSAVPKGASGRDRYQALDDQKKSLIAECEKDPGHRCSIRGYYGGSEWELIKQLEIKDVRLVHAPAGPIGKYGGDIDNWMWPRHTGDYSFYRAYVGPDGKPADFSKDNVPFHPKHHLTVSTEGVQPGDFVMAAGYPGRTNRYRLAAEVENVIDWYYPTRKKAFLEWLDVIEQATARDEDAAIKYASLVSRINNSTKNYDGMLNGFAKSDIVQRKNALEKDLQAWIESDPDRKTKYQSALDDLGKLIKEDQSTQERDLFYSYFMSRVSLLSTARTLYRLSQEKQKPDMEREAGYQERDFVRIQERLNRIERTFDPSVDRAVWRQFILNYAKLPADQHVPTFDAWFGIEGNAVNEAKLDGMLDEMYANTKLGDKETRLSLMESTPADLENSEDPFIKMAVHLYESDLKMENEAKDLVGRFDEVRPKFMEAVVAYYDSQGTAVYPDANSTLRVTYGKVKGYSPKDALTYTPFTTLRGILEKDTGEDPFNAPADQLKWIRDKDYGRFYDEALDSVPVNFLSTLDSTGGNSGSPTMNGKGELVGLLFDGNWESIIADWDFIPAITRTIIVDMRYVLWIMERTEHAGRLLQEMSVAAETTDSEN
jgi:hypothetical protein